MNRSAALIEIRVTARNGARRSAIVSREAFSDAWRTASRRLAAGEKIEAVTSC